MRWSIRLGTLFGIRIELHVTFLLFLGWIAVREGLFGGHPERALATVLLFVLAFACVLFHELGHALTARRFGVRTRDIVLLPIGGVARLERMPDRPAQEMLIAIAGPAVNVALALALGTVMALSGQAVDLTGAGLLSALLLVNLAMVVFNLVPAFPMDGGRVLRAALALRLPYVRATRIAVGVGQAIALGFGLVGLFYNPLLVFVALFVFLAAAEERAMVEARSTLAGFPVQAAMLTEFETLESAEPLRRAVDSLIAGSQQDFPVVEAGAPIGVLTRDDLIRGLQEGGEDRTAGEVVRREVPFAEFGEPLDDAVGRMRAAGRSAIPVVQRGRLVGLLTLENVGDLLLVQDALRRHARSG